MNPYREVRGTVESEAATEIGNDLPPPRREQPKQFVAGFAYKALQLEQPHGRHARDEPGNW
jgi:hypothetical protein